MKALAGRFAQAVVIIGASSYLSSCSVYAPLQSSAPLITQKGQAEVVASGYLSGRLEGSATYSPVKHLLVRAAGGLRTGGGDSTYFRIRQVEAAVGTYRALGEGWLLGGMVGYGSGRSSRRYNDFEIVYASTSPTKEYEARFGKPFAEAYFSRQAHWASWGGACRLSQVRFSTLTNRGEPVPLERMTRFEPMLFMRFGGWRVLPWLQGQLATSLSLPGEGRVRSPNVAIRDTKEGRLYTSLGLVVYPHRFRE